MSAKWLKCKCKMTGPGDLAALDVCARFPWSSGLPLIKERRRGGKKGKYICAEEGKMNRGIWRHKSVSDRLKGWNRERADTLARLKGGRKMSARRLLDAQSKQSEIMAC